MRDINKLYKIEVNALGRLEFSLVFHLLLYFRSFVVMIIVYLSDLGTESVLQACQKKSASVLTTLCVLPAPPLLCNAKQKLEKRDTGTIFFGT